MAAMPDLSPLLATVFTWSRFALAFYAAIATVLTTACLTLQAITLFDRRGLERRSGASPRAVDRPLFVRLEPEAAPAPES